MSDVKWIKIVTDVFNNKKIKQIDAMPDSDTILVIWFKLLCLAGSINENGLIILTKDLAYTDEMLSTEFRKPLNTIRLALRTFENFGMVELVDNVYKISNWEKYQNIDKLNEIREYNRLAKRNQRERKRLEAPVLDLSLNCQPCHDTDIDKDIDIDIDIDISTVDSVEPTKKTKRFTPPTIEEVRAYCIERKNNLNAESFVDYYKARNWMLGKTKMVDWKAAVRTWERNNFGKPHDSRNEVKKDYSDFEKV